LKGDSTRFLKVTIKGQPSIYIVLVIGSEHFFLKFMMLVYLLFDLLGRRPDPRLLIEKGMPLKILPKNLS
jgi:hypothetical protein